MFVLEAEDIDLMTRSITLQWFHFCYSQSRLNLQLF